MSKILVAYFSATGTTKKAAKSIAQAAGADLYEIAPAVPYTSADLDWMNKKSTLLRDTNADIGDYDTIFLGFPIWWYVAPAIINTFLESYDFSGKKIVLFATSGGSGFGRTAAELKKFVAADTIITEGRLLNGRTSAAELKAWIDSVK